LTSVTTDAAGSTAIDGGSVQTTGGQTYNDAVTLGGATTLTGSTVTFSSTLDGGGSSLNLASGTDAVFNGAVSNMTTLTVTGNTTIGGTTITTTGAQNYNGAVNLTVGASTLTVSGGGTVTFGSSVAGGAHNLTLGPSTNGTFTGPVSNVAALAVGGNSTFNGTVSAGSVSVTGTTAINGGSVTTTGTQSYTGLVTLGAATSLGDTTATFVNGIAGGTNSLSITGGAAFDGNVSGITTLSVSGNTAINTATITTSGTQTYGTVALQSNATLNAGGGAKLLTINGLITGQTGNEQLTLLGSNVSLLGGANNLNGGIVTPHAGTLTLRGTFNLGSLVTSNVTGHVALAGNTQLNLGAGGFTLTGLAGGIVGAHGLGIQTTGAVDLTGTNVSIDALNINAAGTKLSNVTTVTGQTYAGPVTLLGGTLKNTGSGDIKFGNAALTLGTNVTIADSHGNVAFGGAVDATAAGAQSLTVSASGSVTASAAIGKTKALSSFTATGGNVFVADVSTTGTQSYKGVAHLGGDLSASGLAFANNVTIASPVLLTADKVDFNGGASSVTGSSTLAIVSRTADLAITIGTGSTGLVLSADALSGYSGLLYVGAVPIAGGVSAGVLGKQPGLTTPGQLGGSITVNSSLHLGSGGALILVSGGDITLSGNTNSLLQADTVVLAANGDLLDPNGSAGITSDNIILAASQIGASAASSLAIFPGGSGSPTLQVGSGNSTSNIGGENTVFQQEQGSNAVDAGTYDLDVGVTAVNSNITNAGQQSAANQQTGGLLGSGFIDVSVFQQISLYDVNGSGIQLPGDQCEEESATGTGCGQ
jgi:hypothetical protein